MPRNPPPATRFERASDDSLLVYFHRPGRDHRAWSEEISIEANEEVRKLLRLLESEPMPEVRNLHPAYGSLLVRFDPLRCRHEEMEERLSAYLRRLDDVQTPAAKLVNIPVCYGGEYGPDLDGLAETHGIAPERVIELHSSASYLVYFLGFVPGFAYLGEVPEEIASPRLMTPRRRVPAGSVGIAGRQTGVYPCETPGGWRLVGRTPVAMFQTGRGTGSLLSMGDRVVFTPISSREFEARFAKENHL